MRAAALENRNEPEPRRSAPHRDPVVVPPIKIAAFCESDAVARMIEQAAADRRMARAQVGVQMGGLPAAVELYGRTPTPSLVIVESHADEESLFAGLDRLADVCLTSTKVLVVGHRNDVSLYRELLQRGVGDYVVASDDALALITAIARLYRGAEVQKLGRICAFVGARGGAGSSTIAHNTAWAIAGDLDTDVLLADMDLPFGTVGLNFNVEAPQGTAEAIQDSARLDDVLLNRLMAKRGDRLSLLTPPASLQNAYDLKENDFDRLIEVARSSARLTVLDLPHVWTSWVRRVLADADEIVITAAPDLANMRNAKGLIEFVRKARPHDAPPKLVLNQVGVPKRPEIKPAAFSAAVELEATLCVPFEPLLFGKAANNGQMIRETSAKASLTRGFTELGQALVGEGKAKPGKRGLGFLARWLRK